MRILTRYVLKEMITPTLLGLAFYTSIIVMRQLFEMAGLIIRQSLTLREVGLLLLYTLPNVVVLTLPMALLFGILIAVGRLSADSEIIAIRALGLSTRTIYRPVFALSVFLFLVNLYLMNVVLPQGNTALQNMQEELLTSGVEKEVRPRIFYDEFENILLYVNDVDPVTGWWKGVFVADNRPSETEGTTPQDAVDEAARPDDAGVASLARGGGERIIVAERGNLAILKSKREIWMNLQKAETHVWDPSKTERYDLTRNDSQRLLLPTREAGSSVPQNIRLGRRVKSMDLFELRDVVRYAKTEDPYLYNLARVEIQKKFAIPFACIAFGILGLPLGITNRRGGKSSGFSLSIGIIVFYYLAINNGEQLAATGKLHPFLGMWSANLILLAVGIYLLSRANRESGSQQESGFFGRLLQRFRAKGAATSTSGAHDSGSILSRLDITFPNTIDRYVLKEFLRVLALVLISVLALFVIIDYTELARDIRENNIPFHTVFAYMRFQIFQVLSWTLPISVLVATLVAFGILSKNNEVTAIKSSGVSLFRVALPIVVLACVLSVVAYFIHDFVLPYSNQRAESIKSRIKGRTRTTATGEQKLWFLGKNNYIINFLAYDRTNKALTQVRIFEFDPVRFRLTRRVVAQRATWNGQAWVFEGGWMRSFTDDGKSTYTPILLPVALQYSETPEVFETEVRSPDQMTFTQLKRYVQTVENAGYAADELATKLWSKTSWPTVSLIMALIALPFSFKMGKKGALYGIGIALILGIVYWLLFAIFMKFGEYGNLPPILAAWTANILFGIAAIYLFLHVET